MIWRPDRAPFFLLKKESAAGGLLLVTCGLQGEQAGVVAVEFDQVFVAAALDDSSVFDDDDLAGHPYRREAV